MHLLVRDHEAGTHGVLMPFSVFATAFSYTNTSQSRVRKTAVVLRKFEVSRGIPGVVASTETQIFINPVGFDYFSRIHLPVWIPNRLEFPECLHQFRPEHLVEKLCSGLPISVFTRQ